jgi:hypothetical protein
LNEEKWQKKSSFKKETSSLKLNILMEISTKAHLELVVIPQLLPYYMLSSSSKIFSNFHHHLYVNSWLFKNILIDFLTCTDLLFTTIWFLG